MYWVELIYMLSQKLDQSIFQYLFTTLTNLNFENLCDQHMWRATDVAMIVYSVLTAQYPRLWLTVLLLSFVMCCVQKDEVYLNLVLEFVPETVYRVARHYSKNKQVMLPIYIKVRYNLDIITTGVINSAFHPSGVGKMSTTSLTGWGWGGLSSLISSWAASKIVWHLTVLSWHPVVLRCFMAWRTYLALTFYPRNAMLARVIGTATCLSVCLSVCYAPVLCQNEES